MRMYKSGEDSGPPEPFVADRLGKVDRDFLRRILLKNTGSRKKQVVVGPGMGLDNAVISIGAGRVMVVTADPLSMIPSVGMEDSAWLSIHELASDITTSAVAPEFAVLDYNLPPSLSDADFEKYVTAMGRECGMLGIAIIGGHTGRYPGSDFTVVGGGVLMGSAGEGEYVTPRMIREGDAVLMTKSAAIEATAVLATAFPQKVEESLGTASARRSRALLHSCSTVVDALTASSVGIRDEGVTSMHDATEGGVLGGLYEIAASSGKSLHVDPEKIPVAEDCRKVCSLFGLDPLVTVGEGALLITCKRERSSEVLRRLSRKGIQGTEIGQVREKGARLLLSKGGKKSPYTPPKDDPYWQAYAAGIANGWK